MAIKLLAAYLYVLAMASLACSEETNQRSDESAGDIFIIAKDKATGDIIDETKYSDVRQSGSCEGLARESAALNPNLYLSGTTRALSKGECLAVRHDPEGIECINIFRHSDRQLLSGSKID